MVSGNVKSTGEDARLTMWVRCLQPFLRSSLLPFPFVSLCLCGESVPLRDLRLFRASLHRFGSGAGSMRKIVSPGFMRSSLSRANNSV
jgi:hypothetical protein